MQRLNNHTNPDHLSSTAYSEIGRELHHSAQAECNFFTAWKRGVAVAGPRYFGDGTREHFERAVTKWDLCPRMDVIDQSIGAMSAGEKRFIAALTSFYNAEDGGSLLERAGVHGLADLGAGLDLKRRTVIAELLLHYNGL